MKLVKKGLEKEGSFSYVQKENKQPVKAAVIIIFDLFEFLNVLLRLPEEWLRNSHCELPPLH